MRNSTETAARLGLVAAALVLACAKPEAAPTPAPAAEEAQAPPPLGDAILPRSLRLPEAAPRPATYRLLEQTRFTLNVQDASLRGLLLGFGRESPLNIIVEAGVSGTVTADLEDVSLLEILDEIVRPLGFQYELAHNVLRVFRTDRETRHYRIDYPNYKRSGNSDLTISGAIESKPSFGGDSDAGGEDASTAGVQTEQIVDFWSEVDAALQTMVFGSADSSEGQEDEDALAEDGDGSELSGAGVPLPRRRVLVSRQAGLITVTAETEILGEVERYLRAVSHASGRQVLIDARILEISLSDDLDFGVEFEIAPDWGDNTVGVFERLIIPGLREASFVQSLGGEFNAGSFSFGIARDDIGIIIEALAQQTDVRVVSTPRIATLNNHKALIKVVRNEVFFVAEVEVTVVEGAGSASDIQFTPQIVPVGVTLDVTPQISEDGFVTMHVHPSVSDIVDVRLQPRSSDDQPETGSLPVIDLREADSVLRIPDSTTVVIGGLIQNREFDRERKVPLLGDIPVLGRLFRGSLVEERRAELVILITPRILDAPRITRIWEETQDAYAGLESLREQRRVTRPWWRQPRGKTYGVDIP